MTIRASQFNSKCTYLPKIILWTNVPHLVTLVWSGCVHAWLSFSIIHWQHTQTNHNFSICFDSKRPIYPARARAELRKQLPYAGQLCFFSIGINMKAAPPRPHPNMYACFVVAIGIRYALLTSKYASYIQQRVEVSTPLNSWKRGRWGHAGVGIYLDSLWNDEYVQDNQKVCIVLSWLFWWIQIFLNDVNYLNLIMYIYSEYSKYLWCVRSVRSYKLCLTFVHYSSRGRISLPHRHRSVPGRPVPRESARAGRHQLPDRALCVPGARCLCAARHADRCAVVQHGQTVYSRNGKHDDLWNVWKYLHLFPI